MPNAAFLLLLFVQPATLWLQHWQQVDKQLFVVVAPSSRPFSAYLFSLCLLPLKRKRNRVYIFFY